MNSTLETLHYSRRVPENWDCLVAEVNDCLGPDPNPDELLQHDAVQLLWDEGRALDPDSFEETRVFAVGRLCSEFMRYAMPNEQAFINSCVDAVAGKPNNNQADMVPLEQSAGLFIGDLATKTFITTWPSGAKKDEQVPLATRLVANTFSIVRPGVEGHVPRELIPHILDETSGREAAKVSIFGGPMFMLQLALSKLHAAQAGERPSPDTPISEIADARAIEELDFVYASYQASKLHVNNLNLDAMWLRTSLIGNKLTIAHIPEQRVSSEATLAQAIRSKAVGCPGVNIEAAIKFTCDASKAVINRAQARLLNLAAASL